MAREVLADSMARAQYDLRTAGRIAQADLRPGGC